MNSFRLGRSIAKIIPFQRIPIDKQPKQRDNHQQTSTVQTKDFMLQEFQYLRIRNEMSCMQFGSKRTIQSQHRNRRVQMLWMSS
jgi:hypothetical protein